MSYSSILVPIAPGFGEEAQRAIAVARSLLAPDGRITVISVLEEFPRYLAMDAAMINPIVQDNHEQVTEDITRTFAAPDVEVVVRRGHPARTILAQASDTGTDCIVVASSQPGWQTYLLGSTASGLVRHAQCSVHVLRGAADGVEVPDADTADVELAARA